MRLRIAALVAVTAAVPAANAKAFSAGVPQTTLDGVVHPVLDDRGIRLVLRAGHPRRVRSAPRAPAASWRAASRRSLIYFAQLSDPQIADEASPARLELLAPARGKFATFWRPQEALGLQVLDAAVRGINRNLSSPVAAGDGTRARLRFALVTGDLTDTAQRNELSWVVRTLEGHRVDPFSGRRVSSRNPCPGASAATIRRLNAAVAGRRYTGVQDYDDWRGRPAGRYRGFWDPDLAPPGGGRFARGPRFPGLLERAQRPFYAQGLRVPWYAIRGNHDALAQGFFGPHRGPPRSTATGCRKLMPSRVISPERFRGNPWSLLRRGRSRSSFVPPDPNRRLVASAKEYRRLLGRANRNHGLGLTPGADLRRSRGAASYYAWTPRRGLRFVALDTAAEAAGPNGNLDHPQYGWLVRQLRAARRRRELVVVFGHHSLATMNNPAFDELAGRFDLDPRRSRPLHLGTRGRASLRRLLLDHPNVILYLAGHVHRNRVLPNFRRDGLGFWEVSTASLADAPQQARLVELMDNGDGMLSIFATLLDHSDPSTPPSGTPATGLSHEQLGPMGRLLAAVAGQGRAAAARAPSDSGNVELVLRDPRPRR